MSFLFLSHDGIDIHSTDLYKIVSNKIRQKNLETTMQIFTILDKLQLVPIINTLSIELCKNLIEQWKEIISDHPIIQKENGFPIQNLYSDIIHLCCVMYSGDKILIVLEEYIRSIKNGNLHSSYLHQTTQPYLVRLTLRYPWFLQIINNVNNLFISDASSDFSNDLPFQLTQWAVKLIYFDDILSKQYLQDAILSILSEIPKDDTIIKFVKHKLPVSSVVPKYVYVCIIYSFNLN